MSGQEVGKVQSSGEAISGTSTSFQSPALRSVLAIAGVAAAASLPSPSEAAIFVSNSLFNVKVGQGGLQSSEFTDFGSLLPAGAGIRFNTRATAGGGPSSFSFIGGVAVWQNQGSGRFAYSSQGGPGLLNAAKLIDLGQTAAINKDNFVNINLGYASIGGSFSNRGNPPFVGVSPSTSKYLMYKFTGSDNNPYFGWIEFLALSGTANNDYSMTIGRIAYQNTPNTTLLAGEVDQPADVPGPIPLAGAALAFGYSRRLRRRMREAEQPIVQ